jgi:hypothetical protein
MILISLEVPCFLFPRITVTAPDKHPRCSFCRKSKDEVKHLISGPDGYACNECIIQFVNILERETDISIRHPCPIDMEAVALIDKTEVLGSSVIHNELTQRAATSLGGTIAVLRMVIADYLPNARARRLQMIVVEEQEAEATIAQYHAAVARREALRIERAQLEKPSSSTVSAS